MGRLGALALNQREGKDGRQLGSTWLCALAPQEDVGGGEVPPVPLAGV